MDTENAWHELQQRPHKDHEIKRYVSKVTDFDLKQRLEGHTVRLYTASAWCITLFLILTIIGLNFAKGQVSADTTFSADFWYHTGFLIGLIITVCVFLTYFKAKRWALLITNSLKYRRAYINELNHRQEIKGKVKK